MNDPQEQQPSALLRMAMSTKTWMPFETAPRDGTHVLVWGKELEWRGTDYTVAYYADGSWQLSLNLCCGPVGEPLAYANNQPTHWMHLPPPPPPPAPDTSTHHNP